MGASVDVVEAYRTMKAVGDLDRVKRMLERGEIHMVTFASSSTVSNFVELFSEQGQKFYRWMERATVACIGPVTAKTAEKKGLKVNLVAPEYTIESLTASIVGFFSHSAS
jgi:uroporphyrinogen III methyltransferase/synthase